MPNGSQQGVRLRKEPKSMSRTPARVTQAEVARPVRGASKGVLVEDRDGRLAYPIPELARKLGVNRKTIERRISDGTFKTVSMLGRRLVTAESVRGMFESGDR
jgi:hypothetical protein